MSTKKSLGAIRTLFLVPEHAANDLERALATRSAPVAPSAEETVEAAGAAAGTGEDEEVWLLAEVQSRAREFIKDRR